MPVSRMEGQAEVGPSTEIALQFGKEPGHGLGVVPDVGAGAVAAADPFPAVEAAVGEPVAGRRGQDRRVEHRAVQEPVGQRGIVPGVVPQPGLASARAGRFSARWPATAAADSNR